MPPEKADQSKLGTDPEDQSSSQPPSRRASWLVYYAAAGIFLATGIFFFLKDSFAPIEVVEVTTVTFLSSDQDTAAPRLVVDTAAILPVMDDTIAYRLEKGRVIESRVELGKYLGGLVEIRHGLAAGDSVVLRPPPKLSSGMKVKIKQ